MPYRGRAAYPSYVDESLFGNPHAAAASRMRDTPAEYKSVAVLGASELGNISMRATKTGFERSSQQEERERLHALSNERKAKWGNTLEATREKKERMRQEKLDAEEAMRQAIDREEEALQAEKRRLVIERANKMLYDSTDRVKALHSKLHLSDVLQEREAQLEIKKAAAARSKVEEERWYQKQQEAIRRMDAEEDAREAEARSLEPAHTPPSPPQNSNPKRDPSHDPCSKRNPKVCTGLYPNSSTLLISSRMPIVRTAARTRKHQHASPATSQTLLPFTIGHCSRFSICAEEQQIVSFWGEEA
eukprot:6184281-Pleurochrysis_carterae.AAC.2